MSVEVPVLSRKELTRAAFSSIARFPDPAEPEPSIWHEPGIAGVPPAMSCGGRDARGPRRPTSRNQTPVGGTIFVVLLKIS